MGRGKLSNSFQGFSIMLDLILKIKDLEKNKGIPFNKVNLRKKRKELTENLLKNGKEFLEIENYVLKIGYANKDKSRPYTMIFTKESYKNYKDYATANV